MGLAQSRPCWYAGNTDILSVQRIGFGTLSLPPIHDMNLIDTHCHLYLEEFSGDIDAVISRAIAAGVQKFYLPNIDSSSIESMLVLEEKYPGKCFAMMGLHPCSVNASSAKELEEIGKLLSQRKFAAVGEIGLDFYWDKTFIDEQYRAFRQQIEWSLQYHLPIVIHSRDSIDECIAVVKEYTSKAVRGVFHCFGGSLEQAEQIIELGFFLGIGGVLTYKKSGLDEILKNIDLKHLVLETDAPYLTPVPFRGKRNESSYLTYVLDKLADVKQRPREEIATITTANALRLFGG